MADTANLVSYTVLADAVTIVTGEKNVHSGKPEVARVLLGGTINALPDDDRIRTLLEARAIRETSKADLARNKLTTRGVFVLGKDTNAASETAAPVQEVVPLDASIEQIKAHDQGDL